ncbi:MAG: hypothetical protein Q8O72_10700 [Bacteroidales bacterium]|nr:hypothetical protein [Bacteroidales bacterium]
MSTGTSKVVNLLGTSGIGDLASLPAATSLNAEDLLLIEQASENKSLSAALLPGGAGFRIDSFVYNDTTEAVEDVIDTYQDVVNDAKPCVVDGNNQVKYFLNRSDFRFKENGEPANIYGFKTNTVVNISGTDYTVLATDFGNVVIRFPKMYYSHRYLLGKHYYQQSKYNFAGSKVHPAFKRYDANANDVIEVDYTNIGKYEGVLFDTSKNRCADGIYIDASITAVSATKTITPVAPIQYLQTGDVIKETTAVLGNANAVYTIDAVTRDANSQTTSFTVLEVINDVGSATTISLRNDVDFESDKLMSVSGYKPLTYISQTEARQLAENNGVKYSQQVYADWFLIQLLAAVKYSTLNIQTELGSGKTGSNSDYKYVSVTGVSNATGMADFIDNTINKELLGGSSIFGLEQLFGNLFKWIEGMMVNNWVISLSEDNSQFDVAGSFLNTGLELPHANGYWGKIINTDKGIFPATVDGSSANDLGDYFYQISGDRVGRVGGNLSSGAFAGLSFLYCNYSALDRSWYIGARVRS